MSTTWIKTQNMDKYMIQLTWGIENSQTHGNKTEWWLPVTGGRGMWEVSVQWVQSFNFGRQKMF